MIKIMKALALQISNKYDLSEMSENEITLFARDIFATEMQAMKELDIERMYRYNNDTNLQSLMAKEIYAEMCRI